MNHESEPILLSGRALVIRRAPGGAAVGTFTGLASTWNIDRHGERIERGAYANSIAALKAGERRIAVLADHQPTNQIGKLTDAQETNEGLMVEGALVLGTPAADRAYELMLNDAVGLSVGFGTDRKDISSDPDGTRVYKNVDLMEVSVVSVPSNRESVLHTVRALAVASPAELERALREGKLPAMPRRLAAKLTRACLPVLAKHEPESDEEPDPEILQASLDELEQTLRQISKEGT